MKVVVFGPARRVGIVQDDQVIDANRAYARYLAGRGTAADTQAEADRQVPADLRSFIAGGQATLDGVQEALAQIARDGADGLATPASAAQIRAPWQPGQRIACAGANYARHAAGIRIANGDQVTPEEMR